MERFIDFISKERANAYKVNDVDTNQDILNRYLYNIDLGKSFYSLLDFMEISLRNRVNAVFISDFGENWIVDNDFFDEQLKQTVADLVQRLKMKNKEINNYRLVSELNFGFWNSLFNNSNNVIWQQNKRLKRVFNNLKYSVKDINRELTVIRKFRNRVFHFETLYTHKPEYCYDLLLKYIKALTCDEFMEIVNKADEVKNLIK